MIILRGIEGGDVDDDAVTPVGGQYPLEGVVDPVGRDRFDLGAHTVLGAEVEHLPGFGDAADHGPGDRAAVGEQREGVQRQGFRGCPDVDQHPVGAQ
jgi:hypothetical protein